jgi:adenosylcobyric acid synthase
VSGYEIHLGRTAAPVSAPRGLKTALVSTADGAALGWQFGAILGVYCHGLLENPALIAALTGVVIKAPESAFDKVADVVERSFTPGYLDSLVLREIAMLIFWS